MQCVFLAHWSLGDLYFKKMSNINILIIYQTFKALLSKRQFRMDQQNEIHQKIQYYELIKQKNISHQLRADYISVSDLEPTRQVVIFSKTGQSTNYLQCRHQPAPKVSNYIKAKKSIVKKKKKEDSDDDYNIKNQKKDRNVTSNLVHHLFKYLTTLKGGEHIVRGIISRYSLAITYEKFLVHLERSNENLKTYVTMKHMKDLWFSQQNLIMRILSRQFFSKNGFLSVFYSNKFNTASKQVHYKGVRSLIQVLIQKDLEQLKFMSDKY